MRQDLKKQGLSANEADKMVKQNPAFEALRQRVTDTFDLLQPELTSIQNWRANGKAGTPPATPYLDRVDELCKYHDVKRQVYIDLLQICSRRDSGCHNACPQLEDYLGGTEEVNWDQVWFACKDRKSIAKNLFQQGRIDEI